MAKISVRTTGMTEAAVAIGIHTPKAVTDEIRLSLRQDMTTIRDELRASGGGGVLKRVTGELARSMKSRVTFRQNRISASAGSRYFVGRLWEDGFTLKMRNKQERAMAPRKWAEPVTSGWEQKIIADIEDAVGRGIARSGF